MTLSTRIVRRALLATGSLVVAGVPLVAAGPADAVSASLRYSCSNTANATSYHFTAVVDTDAPATLGSGMTVPITVTSDLTIPDDLAALLRVDGVATVEGTSQLTSTVDGAERVSTLSIAKTSVPAAGTSMHVLGTGPGGTITGHEVGSTVLIGASSFTTTLTPRDGSGNVVALPGTTTFTCSLSPSTGQDLLVDSVSSVRTTTTTTLVVGGPVEYGRTTTASVEVTQSGSSTPPSGSVAFTYAGRTTTVAVKGGKAWTRLPEALTMGTNQVTAVFTPLVATKSPSQATASFTVVRGPTTTLALSTYRDVRHRLVGTALVTSANETDVAGRVRFTVKRNGTRLSTAIVDLSAEDRARKVFADIRRPGTYVLVAKYLGSATLRRSVDRVKLRINEPARSV